MKLFCYNLEPLSHLWRYRSRYESIVCSKPNAISAQNQSIDSEDTRDRNARYTRGQANASELLTYLLTLISSGCTETAFYEVIVNGFYYDTRPCDN